ncbi:MAG TPA: response regulator [Caldithrix sp.]|nr:response regulator [Caldithrix sp.]
MFNWAAENEFDLIDWVRTKNPSQEIVIITAYASWENRQRAMDREIQSILCKPFEIETLIQEINKYLFTS